MPSNITTVVVRSLSNESISLLRGLRILVLYRSHRKGQASGCERNHDKGRLYRLALSANLRRVNTHQCSVKQPSSYFTADASRLAALPSLAVHHRYDSLKRLASRAPCSGNAFSAPASFPWLRSTPARVVPIGKCRSRSPLPALRRHGHPIRPDTGPPCDARPPGC